MSMRGGAVRSAARAPAAGVGPVRPAATLDDYVAIARPDHWIKHIFVLPGLVFAWALVPDADLSLAAVALGLAAAALISSANYVINEWLDAPFDAHHPT